ncbi:MAG: hypothetical protein OEY63_04360 [Gemmatimonadota bacterium]|nr:hypothetical protein [Gemmatimonadota bacterium]
MTSLMQSLIPQEYSGVVELLSMPLAWIPTWHSIVLNFAWYGSSTGEVIFKRVFILMPVLMLVAAVWSTMLSLYTLPFRSGRGAFLTTMMAAWWDAGRTIWFYFAGLIRVVIVAIGWLWATLRLGFRMIGAGIKGTFQSPMNLLDWTSRHYFKPGMPWVAFLGLLLWGVLEALIFTYTLRPTMTEVLGGITGQDIHPGVLTPVLFAFLYILILGSFACVQGLVVAIESRKYSQIVSMTLVEVAVMFFEVLFLYREMIDAVTPWIAQQSNGELRLGLWATMSLAIFGWMGVRGMTWFLFGRYGAPALVALIARDTVKTGEGPAAATPEIQKREIWKGPVDALKEEVAWFKNEGREAFSLLTLPVLQLLAAAINFVVVVIASRPMFSLPFHDLDEVLAYTPKVSTIQPAEQVVVLKGKEATP